MFGRQAVLRAQGLESLERRESMPCFPCQTAAIDPILYVLDAFGA